MVKSVAEEVDEYFDRAVIPMAHAMRGDHAAFIKWALEQAEHWEEIVAPRRIAIARELRQIVEDVMDRLRERARMT